MASRTRWSECFHAVSPTGQVSQVLNASRHWRLIGLSDQRTGIASLSALSRNFKIPDKIDFFITSLVSRWSNA